MNNVNDCNRLINCLEYTSERIFTLSKKITVFLVILTSSEDINKGI